MSFGGVPQTVLIPTDPLSSLNRIVGLLDRAEPVVRRRFLALIDASSSLESLEAIAANLEAGRINAALAITDDIGPGLASALEQAYMAAGLSAAQVLRSQTDTLFDFNALNQRSVATLQRERLRLVREFSQGQRQASMTLLQDAFERGLAPVEQARALKQSIGLTARQSRAVVNYRRLLSQGSNASIQEALTRRLRDRRFDPTLRAAAAGRGVLTPEKIDRMVERYRERYIQYRANVIARTETVAAVGAGDLEAWEQALESGVIQRQDIGQAWRTAADERVRASHRAMDGQVQPMGTAFVSGAGNSLRFPGDPLGPPADTINCRCVVARELKRAVRTRSEDLEAMAAG